jgi:hypothetical protein
MNFSPRIRAALVLGIFVVAFCFLTISSYIRESATVDEPLRVASSFTALKLHDYRLEASTPPFLRICSALPLLTLGHVNLATNSVAWDTANDNVFGHEFMYVQNDADALLYRARLMSVLWGILLGLVLFLWARDLFGFWVATAALGLYCLEPVILAHTRLVTTDIGVSCLMFATVYSLWQMTRRATLRHLLALAACFSLSQVGKFSAVLLMPIVVLLLLVTALRRRPWNWEMERPRQLNSRPAKLIAAAGVFTVLMLTAYLMIWASYSFRHAPTPAGETTGFSPDQHLAANQPVLASAADWIDRHHLLPNGYVYGFLNQYSCTRGWPAYLVGQISDRGWWYYFPIAFTLKTSATLLLLFAAGLVWCIRDRDVSAEQKAFLLLPVAIYLAAAMTTRINIGVRHLLPIYPFVLLVAGLAISRLIARVKRPVLLALCAVPILEVAMIYPHYLAYFNAFCGGPANGHKLLGDSNIDWGQDLKGLKVWMTEHRIGHINLAYFGLADPAYYQMNCTILPGTLFPTDSMEKPRLPGYVAVSVQVLQTGFIGGQRTDFYRPLLQTKPVAVIGYSIHVYWVDHPWWTEWPPASSTDDQSPVTSNSPVLDDKR